MQSPQHGCNGRPAQGCLLAIVASLALVGAASAMEFSFVSIRTTRTTSESAQVCSDARGIGTACSMRTQTNVRHCRPGAITQRCSLLSAGTLSPLSTDVTCMRADACRWDACQVRSPHGATRV